MPTKTEELESKIEKLNEERDRLENLFRVSLFFGCLGIDRFLQGKIATGFFKALFFVSLLTDTITSFINMVSGEIMMIEKITSPLIFLFSWWAIDCCLIYASLDKVNNAIKKEKSKNAEKSKNTEKIENLAEKESGENYFSPIKPIVADGMEKIKAELTELETEMKILKGEKR